MPSRLPRARVLVFRIDIACRTLFAATGAGDRRRLDRGAAGDSPVGPGRRRERRTMTSAVPLQLLGISKSFGSVRALRPMTQTIEGGEMLALLGPSGCG